MSAIDDLLADYAHLRNSECEANTADRDALVERVRREQKEIIEALEGAERALEKIERNEQPIFDALRTSKDPGISAPFLSTSGGMKRNLARVRPLLAKLKG